MVESNDILHNYDDLEKLIRKKGITGIYLILGNGRGPQYRCMEQVKSSLRPVMQEIDKNHHGMWLAVYCGLPYYPDCPDIATCMEHIKEEYKPYILSVQSRREKDHFVDFVYKYENIRDREGRLVNKLELCGKLTHRWNFLAVLSNYIGPWFLDHLVYGVVNIDSAGPIGDMELESAREAGLKILQVAPADPARDPTLSWGLEGTLGYEVDREYQFCPV